ncbi:hypothetical protein [Duganella radicis]|uniref:Uncharacterized protein n=1 Tax=Duganella radicis TaxID=551988 RepID=A0A6L6PBX7_9BURK|nr:hypothetical protein [Duganella radicis]MTV36081.1 hypothetical protein [Duganella radicis]
MTPAQKMLSDIAQNGLHGVDHEYIIYLAKAIWYYDLLPDLGALDGPFRNDVGYFSDSLAHFSVLPAEQSRKLRAALLPYKPAAPCDDPDLNDPLAREWHSSCDIMPFYADILQFQTRHYAAGWPR